MNAAHIIASSLSLIAGAGIFLTACDMMSANLRALGSRRLDRLLARASKSRLVGVGIGTAATVAVQSSSATTVAVIGLVNAGAMSLAQAATVIFGANIGTTVTGQLVALGMLGSGAVSVSAIFSACAGIGAFVVAFAKSDRAQRAGGLLAGFGMMFAALCLMSDAVEDFAASDIARNALAAFSSPLALFLVGALLTAVVQSSSVVTSVAITTVVSGLISLDQAVYVTLGANVGTCATALLAGAAGSVNARRVALVHLIFNLTGAAAFLGVGGIMRLCGTSFGGVLGSIFPSSPQIALASFHTAFNVASAAVALPLTGCLVKLVTFLVPDKPATAKGGRQRARDNPDA